MRRFSFGTLAMYLVIAGSIAGALTFFLFDNPHVPKPLLLIPWALGALLVLFGMRRYVRRLLGGKRPSEGVLAALESKVSYYRELDEAGRARFAEAVHYFLLDQNIVGVHIEVDDELRALVAASAVVLAFGRPSYEWDSTRDIIIYPDAFDADYVISAKNGTRAGQVGYQGPIIFSARALQRGFANSADGHNVGYHEFAHVLDLDDGAGDGVPTNLNWNAIRPWVDQMMTLMAKEDKHGKRAAVLRAYGYTNEAEFFACATEMFFEQPAKLNGKAPELYRLLGAFYGQDPGGVLDRPSPRAALRSASSPLPLKR